MNSVFRNITTFSMNFLSELEWAIVGHCKGNGGEILDCMGNCKGNLRDILDCKDNCNANCRVFVWAIVGKCTKYFMAIVPKHFLRLLYYEGNCYPQFPATRRGRITKKIFPPIPVDTDKPFISLPTIKSR